MQKSLRKKRNAKPKISAPTQISNPLPISPSTDSLSSRPNIKLDGPAGGLPQGPRPRARPQNGDATADLIQRRYSTRFANAPSDFGVEAPPLPSVPSIPGKFAASLPPSRDGRPSMESGRRIKIDVKALSNPNFKPDQCRLYCRGSVAECPAR